MSEPRIYVVEDEALIAMDLCDRLRSLGYEICGKAARAERALEEIPRLKPDLVLMDIQLGEALSGIDVATRLRPVVDVPIVFLSAFSDDTLVQSAVEAGAFGYLVKPFEERELNATLQAALAKHRTEFVLKDDNRRQAELLRVLLERERQRVSS